MGRGERGRPPRFELLTTVDLHLVSFYVAEPGVRHARDQEDLLSFSEVGVILLQQGCAEHFSRKNFLELAGQPLVVAHEVLSRFPAIKNQNLP